MNERVIILDEPVLQFADGHSASDPHDGLALFGPFGKGRLITAPLHPILWLGPPLG